MNEVLSKMSVQLDKSNPDLLRVRITKDKRQLVISW